MKPGVLELNSIRNKFGHRLEVNIQEVSVEHINNALAIARSGVSFDNNLERVEAFTTVACTFLIIPKPEFQAIFMEAFKNVRVRAS